MSGMKQYTMFRKNCKAFASRRMKGQITVMLSLLLTVVLLFLLTCSEGVRVYLGKGRAARKLVAAQEDVMADYNRFLWEEYHILGVDESYGTKDTDALQKRLEEYLLDAFAGMPNTTENGFLPLQYRELELYRSNIHF